MIVVIYLLTSILITNAFPTDQQNQQEFDLFNTNNEKTPNTYTDLSQTQKETIKKILSASSSQNTQHTNSESIPQYTRRCVTILKNGNEIKTINTSEEEPIQEKSSTFDDDLIFEHSKQLDVLNDPKLLENDETNLNDAANLMDEKQLTDLTTNIYEYVTETSPLQSVIQPQTTPTQVSTEPNADNLPNSESTKTNEPKLKRTCVIFEELIETTIRRNDLEKKDQSTTPPNLNVVDNTGNNQKNSQNDPQIPSLVLNSEIAPQYAIMQPFAVDNSNSPYGKLIFYTYRKHNTPQHEVETTTATSTTSTSTSSPTNYVQEPLYSPQMKFVLPMPYAEPDAPSNFPWKFDQYAYYPKHMQPSLVNVPMTYNPTFHMIRALAIPRNFAGNYYVPGTQYYEQNE